MDKFLVNSEEQYVALFDKYELDDVENFLGVEFAFKDGTYQSDDYSCIDEDDQEIVRTAYKKSEYSVFPKEYPCLVLLAIERDFDRTGSIAFELLDFVYLSDFQQ